MFVALYVIHYGKLCFDHIYNNTFISIQSYEIITLNYHIAGIFGRVKV